MPDALTSAPAAAPALMRRMQPWLGTFVEVAARGPGLSQESLSAAFAAIAHIHEIASFQSAESALTRLNQQPGQWLVLPCHLLRLLRLARAMTRQSQGLFNATVGGEMVALSVLPDHGGPAPLARGEAEDIELDGQRARLRRPVRITLDGLAKGYAVDRAVAVLRRQGATAGWVNAGGDLRVFGELALPLQRREADERLTTLGEVRHAAVASSVIRPAPDHRYPGFLVGAAPVGVAQAWTVLAAQCWRADALTKVAALAPDAEREALIASLGGRLLAGMAP